MKAHLRIFGLITFIAVSAVSSTATAAVLYTNFGPGQTYDTGSGYFVDGSNFTNQVVAFPFSPASSGTVGQALLALGNFAGANNPVTVYLESDGVGQPGSILTTLSQVGTIAPFGSGGSVVAFTCSGAGCSLSGGTTYWLVAQETDPNTQQAWFWTAGDPSGPGAFDQNGSATGPWNTFNGAVSAFELDSSTVPEPASLVFLGSGMLALLGVSRRLRRS